VTQTAVAHVLHSFLTYYTEEDITALKAKNPNSKAVVGAVKSKQFYNQTEEGKRERHLTEPDYSNSRFPSLQR